ncbi:unnamed protein product [Microthlaspi erraticum]|uniref:DUF4218 domain-containing protein n=1 Tax=Microthlaspi erraticum TaxID=1685480 RepID=A0A6D2JR20_9BRAS|nr:unnamed protein product [Microthlaspi erraticum]
MDKAWVWLPRTSLEYELGCQNFVNASSRSLGNLSELFCPCVDCRNVCHQPRETVVDHLVIRGMDQKYKRNQCWSKHEEQRKAAKDDVPTSESEAYNLIRTAFFDGEDNEQDPSHIRGEPEASDSAEESQFRDKLNEAETPLYTTCHKYTKVSAIMVLYRIKVKSGMSENSFDQLLTAIKDMLPEDNLLPKPTDEMKKFLKIFGFGYDVIHACKNDCILYRKQYQKMESCPRCSTSRWEVDKHSGEEKIGIAAKVLRYFPIKDRFKRMFRSKRMAEDLRWPYSNNSEDGTMRHPVDSITWAQVNDNWPVFAAEPRNLRLGLSTDGMNPFSIQNTKYSTWPVLLVNYNLPPTMCMKVDNIMLTMLIPGPTAPSNNIDVYLAPLIDDLKELWNEGIEIYDSFMKEKFTLRAVLLWTISDYPALGTLSGCKVKGKQGCNVCGKDTLSRWLKFSRKYVYLGNRKCLRPTHPYRRKKRWFDNTIEEGNAMRIQTGAEILEVLNDYRNVFGKPLDKQSKRKRAEVYGDDVASEDEYEEDSDQWRWKKRSIFYELPYWKDLLVRHNIDVMHVEKNMSDAILSTLMQSAKSKDGLKARRDLEDMGIREHLHTQVRGKRTYLPPAAYWLSKEEKKRFYLRLSKFRGPDGYCANISSCVSMNPPAIGGLKSHDHHVLLQNLLDVVLRGLLPKGPRLAVTRVCSYFTRLCQRSIDPEKLIHWESEFVETMCQMERFFPPSLFDIMFHLPIHLARETRLGGPVHFRWMYPFERCMKTLKAFVKNYARPEACMAEGYLAEECIAFYLEFLRNSVPIEEAVKRNEHIQDDDGVLEGRSLKKATEIILSEKEKDIAHRYVLMNTGVMEPYIEIHLEELQANDVRCRNNETLLWKLHNERFANWIKEKIPANSKDHSSKIRWLAFGPRLVAQSHKGFIINGKRYHTDDYLYLNVRWANKGNGVKEEDGFTLVNLHLSQVSFHPRSFHYAFSSETSILLERDESSPWYVVMKAPPRGSVMVKSRVGMVRRSKRKQGLAVTPEMKAAKVNKQVEEKESEDEVEQEEVQEKEVQEEESEEEVEKAVEEEVRKEVEEVAAANPSQPNLDETISTAEQVETQQSVSNTKRKRGLTKMRKVAKDPLAKVEVEFTSLGEHARSGSVTLSSFLDPLVREHVPVLLDDWRQLDDVTKDTLWEEIQGRFNLQEEWQKQAVFRQMGCLLQAYKSRLVRELLATKSHSQRLKLKPSNIQSMSKWMNWVKSRTSKEFKVKSDKYRDLRKSQISHTTSRKGMFRLAYEMGNLVDPTKVSRSKVWLAGHTHSDGTPVRPEFSETIEQIQSIDSQMESTANDNIKEDVVSQVLGTDKPGRIRGLGRGITATKLAFLQARDAHVQKLEASQAQLISELEDLKNVVRDLAGKKKQCDDLPSHSELSHVSKGGVKCQLLDWFSVDDVVVGEGEFCASDPTYKIDNIPLGPNAAAVLVNTALDSTTYVWRPTKTMFTLEQAVCVKIPWPVHKVILDSGMSSPSGNKSGFTKGASSDDSYARCRLYDWNIDGEIIDEGLLCSTDPKATVNSIPLGPNAAIVKIDSVLKEAVYLWRPTSEMLVTASTSSGSNKGPKKKCILMDCNNSGQKVAEGRVCSTDPADVVHFKPLGPNASKVWVEVSKIGDAKTDTSSYPAFLDLVMMLVEYHSGSEDRVVHIIRWRGPKTVAYVCN